MIVPSGRDVALAEAPPLDHLLALTDDTGTIQHATYDVPNRSTGYCTDDVARALIVSIRAGFVAPPERDRALGLARTSLAFLAHAQLTDGRFHNFMSYGRTWLDDVGTEDANGRAIWALGVAVRSAPTFGFRALAREILVRALPTIASIAHLRSRTYAALGLVEALGPGAGAALPMAQAPELGTNLAAIGTSLREAYEASATAEWPWFESAMTYDNARLCQAAIEIGEILESAPLLAIGAASFAFYERTTVVDGRYLPIGNDGWYPRGAVPSRFDQQPLEAAALVDAALAAARAAERFPGAGFAAVAHYHELARIGLDWFHGANVLGRSLVTPQGACCDGLSPSGVNANAGAESTLAYLSAAYALAEPSSDR